MMYNNCNNYTYTCSNSSHNDLFIACKPVLLPSLVVFYPILFAIYILLRVYYVGDVFDVIYLSACALHNIIMNMLIKPTMAYQIQHKV